MAEMNQNDPILLNNNRPASLPALEIITSKYLALCVRILAMPLCIGSIVLAGIALSSHTKLAFQPFLITVIVSLGLSSIDAISLGFEIWGPPLEPAINRASSQQHGSTRNSYRASPGWRGTFDLALLVALAVAVFGMNKCRPHDPRLPCRQKDGKVLAAQYLGVMIACGHLWLCAMAVLESFWKHRKRELQGRNDG